ncbi:MAG: C-type lectin domain-containing protein, partial [Planctomycetaceae bacterium]|nr:C-type lectin domain-containing protein [Planctomycetaceae bacterium]
MTGAASGAWNDVSNAAVYPAILEWMPDTDQDGLLDEVEDFNFNGVVDPGETDPLDQDSDDDGLSDGEEVETLRQDTRWIQSPSGDFYRLAPADTWSQARAAAVAQGYDLTSIQDQAEADWLYSTFGDINDGFWIGLNDFSGIFEWSDGSPVNY